MSRAFSERKKRTALLRLSTCSASWDDSRVAPLPIIIGSPPNPGVADTWFPRGIHQRQIREWGRNDLTLFVRALSLPLSKPGVLNLQCILLSLQLLNGIFINFLLLPRLGNIIFQLDNDVGLDKWSDSLPFSNDTVDTHLFARSLQSSF